MPIHPTAIIDGTVDIQDSASIGAYCVLEATAPGDHIIIRDEVTLGHHSVATGRVELGHGTVADPFTMLGPNSIVGARSRLLYGARLHENSIVGDDSVIAGNVPDNTRIGNRVVHLGRLAHSLHYPLAGWDSVAEMGPTIDDEVVIGVEALVIGAVSVGRNSLILPREIVRTDVPPDTVVRAGELLLMPNWRQYLRALGAAESDSEVRRIQEWNN